MSQRQDVHIHFDEEVVCLFREMHKTLLAIHCQGEKIMATLDEVLADVTAETTKIDSISTLISGLKQQIADALSGAALPPAVQAKADAVFAAAETNKAKIDAALAANVPPVAP